MSYRIAHFSDFHLTSRNAHFDRCLKLIVDATDRGAEHLVITGDLVESGQMKILASFLEEIKHLGWNSSDHLTIIPGNHDIFPASLRAFSPLKSPTSLYKQFIELTRDASTGRNCRRLLRGEAYPFGKVLAGRIALVGLDTTRNGQRSPLKWAQGELPIGHQQAAERFLDRHRHLPHRIVAMHHHPWREVFSGGASVEQNFMEPPPEEVWGWLRGIEPTLVLCGHVHRSDGVTMRRIGPSGTVLRCGASGGMSDSENHVYHLIDLKPDGARRITRRMLSNAL